ncbi:MAG: GTP-binding protein [Nanoarchaeota archaeon]
MKEENRQGVSARIKELEDQIKNTKYNKRTQHAVGLYKAKLAQLKEKQETRRGIGKGDEGYSVRRTGDATVVLVGFPSVGKSTLLNQLTNAKSKTAAYAFTTLTVVPGLMEYKHAKIQILDVPGILKGAADGTGRGREVLSVLTAADMALILIDVFEPHQLDVLQKELYDAHLRLNREPPDIKIKKTGKGGISVSTTVQLTKTTKETVAAILRELRLMNADVLIRDDVDADQVIDAVEGNKRYLPAVIAINKIDTATPEEFAAVAKAIPGSIPISAEQGVNIDLVKERIFQGLGFLRIYMKEVGKKADMNEPLIIRGPATVEQVCRKLHQDFIKRFRFARVWGRSAKFPGQKFKLNHTLADEDVLQVVLR